jgi:hypothetical protein
MIASALKTEFVMLEIGYACDMCKKDFHKED